MTASAFEGKLHSYRRTQDGAVVAFVIHPSNVTAELALAPIGTRFMIGHAEIGDDETPVSARAARIATEDSATTEPPRETSKRRTPFAQLPLSQQAGIACKDEAFRAWLARKEGVPCSVDVALLVVRGECGVNSRAELDEPQNGEARARWLALYDDFAAWKLTQAYAETLR